MTNLKTLLATAAIALTVISPAYAETNWTDADAAELAGLAAMVRLYGECDGVHVSRRAENFATYAVIANPMGAFKQMQIMMDFVQRTASPDWRQDATKNICQALKKIDVQKTVDLFDKIAEESGMFQ